MTSKIKVDNVNKVSDDSNIIKKCGTTITLGASGDSIALASGASQTGFGRTGTVDWDVTPKTASFTAVSGNGYFVDTSSSEITVTLPAGSAGAIVSIADYKTNFGTNKCSIAANGSEKIGGESFNLDLNVNGLAVTLIYVDATEGWVSTASNEVTNAAELIAASGGTETTCGDYKIHTFTGPGTFTVTAGKGPEAVADYLVIAGGGGAQGSGTGGGGAGGYRFSDGTASGCYSAGPAPLGASAIPVIAQAYPITVGSGGSGNAQGSNTIFSTITSTGGGLGNGGDGGSGGGAIDAGSPGSGNTPPVSPPQGNNGGDAYASNRGGGGGGAGGVGTTSTPSSAGPGGSGLPSSITGSGVTRGGGGGGGNHYPGYTNGIGGTGGGGSGGGYGSPGAGCNATANTGGGAGGGGGRSGINAGGPSNGGSGIVVIRYKFQ